MTYWNRRQAEQQAFIRLALARQKAKDLGYAASTIRRNAA